MEDLQTQLQDALRLLSQSRSVPALAPEVHPACCEVRPTPRLQQVASAGGDLEFQSALDAWGLEGEGTTSSATVWGPQGASNCLIPGVTSWGCAVNRQRTQGGSSRQQAREQAGAAGCSAENKPTARPGKCRHTEGW